jgi:predicted lipoprotein with Yx(FWY)xxD motif
MKRSYLPVSVLVIVAAASAFAVTTATARSRPTVRLAKTALGRILVTNSGRTVYSFARDGRNRDRCVQISGCASVWPPVTTSRGLIAGAGVRRSLLGTIKLANGRRQVTYAGHPLYTYSGDTGPGQTDYVGAFQFQGVWSALNASGHKLTRA